DYELAALDDTAIGVKTVVYVKHLTTVGVHWGEEHSSHFRLSPHEKSVLEKDRGCLPPSTDICFPPTLASILDCRGEESSRRLATLIRRMNRQDQMEEKTTRADDRDKQRPTFRCSAN